MLQLLSLVRVLEHQRVNVAVASHFELDVVRLGRLLDAGGCSFRSVSYSPTTFCQ